MDQGLLPACVVVCPTESLIFGDIANPASRAAQVIASKPTTVRRPEQGTRPQAYYVGASPTALDPLAAVHEDRYIWADRRTGGAKDFTATLSAAAPAGSMAVGSGAASLSLRGTMLPVLTGVRHRSEPSGDPAWGLPPRSSRARFRASPRCP